MINLKLVTGLTVFINPDLVMRVWEEDDGERKGQTAVMYTGGATDHTHEKLPDLIARLEKEQNV